MHEGCSTFGTCTCTCIQPDYLLCAKYMYRVCYVALPCLTLLASFFLPSHLSFKNMYMYPGAKVCVITREAQYCVKTRAFTSFYGIILRAHAARAVA